jgi:membrane-bound ClpP family serine protease
MENIIESLIQNFEVTVLSMAFVTIFVTWVVRKFFGGDMTFFVRGKKLDAFPFVPIAVALAVVGFTAEVVWPTAPKGEVLFYGLLLGAVSSGLYSQYKAFWEKPDRQ